MKKICVIFGGTSCEHDISIITGMQLAKSVKPKFELEKIYLGLDNKFYLATNIEDLTYFKDKSKIKLKEIYILSGSAFQKGILSKKLFDIECVINCCHGGVGENGDLAGYFACQKVKFTSADCLNAHIAMDKSLTKKLLDGVVPTIKGEKITKTNFEEKIKLINETFPNDLIVKPNSLGSSIGVKTCNKTDFVSQVNAIFELKDDALVEERVTDLVEYNQACVRDGEKLVLSAIEMPKTDSQFLTFDDKYKSGKKNKRGGREIPAKISKSLESEICGFTKQVYEILNMNGVARIDYIYDKTNKKLYFNEINTNPGSMSFYLFEPVGIDYIDLVEILLRNAKEIKDYAYFDTLVLKENLI